MDEKTILETKFKSNYDSASAFLDQNKLDEALEFFIRAYERANKLAEICIGDEKNYYTAKKSVVARAIHMIREKKLNLLLKPFQSVEKEESQTKSEKTVEDCLKKLDELIGLDSVKKEVRTIISVIKANKMRKEMGLHEGTLTLNMLLRGSPGTGKTTVARIITEILHLLGVLEKGQLVEVQREDLVGKYVGQTACKTQAKINEAIGGVFFVDEVYRLSEGDENDLAKEALGQILSVIGEKSPIIMFAGLEEKIKDFVDMNPGVSTKFPITLHFEDYTVDELYQILESFCKKNSYVLSDTASIVAKERIQKMYDEKDESFGNARSIRNFFDEMVKKQASRVVSIPQVTKEILMTFMPEDVPEV